MTPRGQRRMPFPVEVAFRVLRLLLVAVCFQMSGVAEAVLAVDEVFSDDSGCCTDCPLEKSGHECPPSCPSCHCHHNVVAAVSKLPDECSSPRSVQDLDLVGPVPREATAPREPFLPSVFRPPRSRSHST